MGAFLVAPLLEELNTGGSHSCWPAAVAQMKNKACRGGACPSALTGLGPCSSRPPQCRAVPPLFTTPGASWSCSCRWCTAPR